MLNALQIFYHISVNHILRESFLNLGEQTLENQQCFEQESQNYNHLFSLFSPVLLFLFKMQL